MGLIFAARFAGMYPAIAPNKINKKVAKIAVPVLM
jgi:hypothetical protein